LCTADGWVTLQTSWSKALSAFEEIVGSALCAGGGVIAEIAACRAREALRVLQEVAIEAGLAPDDVIAVLEIAASSACLALALREEVAGVSLDTA